jgi:RNA polymerase sigma-70 factor (ECF subfamily)
MDFAAERTLALRARQGEQDAFGELVCLHQTDVYNVALRLLGSPQEAEDAAQETFLRAWRYFAQYDLERPLGPWLKRIAANVCFQRLNRIPPEESGPDQDDPHQPAAPDLPPEAETLSRERDRRIREEILRLPPRYRMVIELRHFQELSYDEIAASVKRPLSDVKSDLFRARKMLAERLKDIS